MPDIIIPVYVSIDGEFLRKDYDSLRQELATLILDRTNISTSYILGKRDYAGAETILIRVVKTSEITISIHVGRTGLAAISITDIALLPSVMQFMYGIFANAISLCTALIYERDKQYQDESSD